MTKGKYKDYHGDPRFYEILERLAQLHSDKNHDYASKEEPLSNLKRCKRVLPPWKGVIVRLTDKMDRLLSYAEKGEYKVKDEGLKDTFYDMAVYSILGVILFEEEQHTTCNTFGGCTVKGCDNNVIEK